MSRIFQSKKNGHVTPSKGNTMHRVEAYRTAPRVHRLLKAQDLGETFPQRTSANRRSHSGGWVGPLWLLVHVYRTTSPSDGNEWTSEKRQAIPQVSFKKRNGNIQCLPPSTLCPSKTSAFIQVGFSPWVCLITSQALTFLGCAVCVCTCCVWWGVCVLVSFKCLLVHYLSKEHYQFASLKWEKPYSKACNLQTSRCPLSR